MDLPVLLHPPIVGQPRPLRYRTQPDSIAIPTSYPPNTTTFISPGMHWTYPNIFSSSYPDMNYNVINSQLNETVEQNNPPYFPSTDLTTNQSFHRLPFTANQMKSTRHGPPPPFYARQQIHQQQPFVRLGPTSPCPEAATLPPTTMLQQSWDFRPPLVHSITGPFSPPWGAKVLSNSLYETVPFQNNADNSSNSLQNRDQLVNPPSIDPSLNVSVPPPPTSISSNLEPKGSLQPQLTSTPRHPASQLFKGNSLRIGKMEPRK